VIEEALRRDIGFDVLERLWGRDLDDEAAMALALEAQANAGAAVGRYGSGGGSASRDHDEGLDAAFADEEGSI
jgi:hypothetical protein